MAGTLSRGSHAWLGFVRPLAAAADQNQAFVARNFLLDEGIPEVRFRSYDTLGCLAAHKDFAAWEQRHKDYMGKRVFRANSGRVPAGLEADDDLLCPETFQVLDGSSLFVNQDLGLDLIRLATVDRIARVARISASDLKSAAQAYLSNPGDRDLRQALDDLLEGWAIRADNGPTFAAFYQDVEEVLKAGDGWEDVLRDALGLLHLSPADRTCPGIDILVFRYLVKDVPKLRPLSDRQRPLAAPTVLDGGFSPAFCPSPRGSATGHVVDLRGGPPSPRREVVHPVIAWRARHLALAGTIRRPVDTAILRDARALHLLSIRDLSGRADYAADTDGDLLS